MDLVEMDRNYGYIPKIFNLIDNNAQIQNCVALNFGYNKRISVPQLTMSLDQENVDNLDQSSINCFFVITSGQYGQMMDKLQKINETR